MTDEVQDLCYEKYEEGHCSGPGTNAVTRSQCCCSTSKGLFTLYVLYYLFFICFGFIVKDPILFSLFLYDQQAI